MEILRINSNICLYFVNNTEFFAYKQNELILDMYVFTTFISKNLQKEFIVQSCIIATFVVIFLTQYKSYEVNHLFTIWVIP